MASQELSFNRKGHCVTISGLQFTGENECECRLAWLVALL